MITKDKEYNIISLLFLITIIYIVVNLIAKFTLLDLTYLIFLVCCFIRFIFIKKK